MNGVEFSNALYAIMLQTKKRQDLPDEWLEQATRLTTRSYTVHLPLVFVEFLERMAGQKISEIVEEAVISHITKSGVAAIAFEAFCNHSFARRMKDEEQSRQQSVNGAL